MNGVLADCVPGGTFDVEQLDSEGRLCAGHVRAASALTIRKPLSPVFRALNLCSSRLIRDASDSALPFPFRKPKRRASAGP